MGPRAGLISCVGSQKTKGTDQQVLFSSKEERSLNETLQVGTAREGTIKELTHELTTTHSITYYNTEHTTEHLLSQRDREIVGFDCQWDWI